jgi:type IV pilus assembly protein PilB
MPTKKKLGEILVDCGLINPVQLHNALEYQKKHRIPLGKIITEMFAVTENQIAEALSQQTGFPYINLFNYPIRAEVVTLVPRKLVQRFLMIPFGLKGDQLLVAAADPYNIEGADTIRQITKKELVLHFATEEDIQFIINRYYDQKSLAQDAVMLQSEKPADLSGAAAESLVLNEDVPVVKFINSLLSNAFRRRASDIHIEPGESELRVRFRIDGSLYEVMRNLSLNFHAQIISRIKVMANLDIAERRLPQDGRVPIEVDGKKADLRVSIIPSNFGEKIVLRILYKQLQYINLESIGLQERDLETVNRILTYPYGLIYVSGPTGSGKTTTLYAFLRRLNSVHKNLITLEDPIEYLLPGITQVNINPKIGLTFAHGLRSFLRQDPDIIMVGETRDEETAEITVQAALTGHLVLSTIHTNDSVGVASRLLNMKVEPYLSASALVAVVSQRLVRTICPKCKTVQPVNQAALNLNRFPADFQFYHGVGCEFCQNTGFIGRTGIYEILEVDDEIREAIVARTPQTALRNLAVAKGMRLLLDSGLELVRRGVTTIDEVLGVTAFN